MQRRRFISATSLLAVSALARPTLSWGASAYPDHTIRLIVPLAPGGGTDLVSRLVAAEMGKQLGASVAVENLSGGGGIIGVSAAVRSPADGYTLLTGAPSLSINPALRPDLNFDPVKDLAPISMLSRVPYVLVASRASGLTSVEGLLSKARAAPLSITYGSPGIGTGGHMAAELFQYLAKVKLTHVPYKGSGPAMNDLRAGRIDLLFGTTPAVVPLVQSGVLVPVAMSSAQRSSALPDVPTIAESGIANYEASSWYSLFAPAGTPEAIIGKLNAAVRFALAQPRVKQAITLDGGHPEPMSPQQLGVFLAGEIAKWRKVVAAAHLQPS